MQYDIYFDVPTANRMIKEVGELPYIKDRGAIINYTHKVPVEETLDAYHIGTYSEKYFND